MVLTTRCCARLTVLVGVPLLSPPLGAFRYASVQGYDEVVAILRGDDPAKRKKARSKKKKKDDAEVAAEATSSDNGDTGDGEIGGVRAPTGGGTAIDAEISVVTDAQSAGAAPETASESQPRPAPPKADPWDLRFMGPGFDDS